VVLVNNLVLDEEIKNMNYKELLEKYNLLLNENNRLSYGSAQESIMRIESDNIGNELIKSIERQ